MTVSIARAAHVSPALSVRDLIVTYKGMSKPTVSDISFDVSIGETVLITGRSGSGKSTLAMTVAGLIPASVEGDVEGELFLHPDFASPGKIGYVFQDPDAQFCMQHVDDEIAFGLENLQIPREQMVDKITKALQQVGQQVPLHASHTTFSGGMKQKLAIASALALDADLFIFDEPTANLDPLATRQVFETILRLQEMGKTILVIEHKFNPILPYVDKVIDIAEDGVGCRVSAAKSWVASTSVHMPQHDEGSRLNSLQADPFTTKNPILELCDCQLSYGKQAVWRDVSLALNKGEWVAILGPNGAGKSSLLEVLAGLTHPTSGEVMLNGSPLRRMRKRDIYRTIAYGFQNPEYQFLYERTGDEMVGHIVEGNVPAEVYRQLAQFGLADFVNMSPYQLSQGQKRRLAVAVMLQENHELYLFDEPTYGQDEQSEAAILAQLSALRDIGKTIVTVTHDVSLVRKYANRVLVVADEKLLYDGSVEGLFKNRELLLHAHILDDVRPITRSGEASDAHVFPHEMRSNQLSEDDATCVKSIEQRSWFAEIHPGVKLLTLLITSTFTMFVNNFTELSQMWTLVIVITFGLAWCQPYRLAKRMSVVLLFYLIYLWTFSANSAVPNGYHEIHWLWFQISAYGFWKGVLVALRTFATVVYAYVFLVTTDGTDFLVSLSQSFRISPKLSYAMMAGTSFIPRFQRDLRTFRQAKAVRGRHGIWLFRPVTYALPLLSQAIRHSERMAIAMEARGFQRKAAEKYDGRTYYRETPVRGYDYVFAVLVLIATIYLFWW